MKVKDKGSEFDTIIPYLAYESAEKMCPKCCTNDRDKWCKPLRCYTVGCATCKYFGHTKNTCHNDRGYPNPK